MGSVTQLTWSALKLVGHLKGLIGPGPYPGYATEGKFLIWLQLTGLKIGVTSWIFHLKGRQPKSEHKQKKWWNGMHKAKALADKTIGKIPSGPVALEVSKVITHLIYLS